VRAVTDTPGTEHERLAVLVGSSRTEGWTGRHRAFQRRGVTQYFGSDGPTAYEAELSEEEGHWEQTYDGSTWQPWMDITLSKR
jgi:hypothetical protein